MIDRGRALVMSLNMVAEAAAAPPKSKRKVGEHGPAVSILAKTQARNLYLNQHLPYAAISDRTGLPVKTLQCLASREGWTALRRLHEKKLIESSDAQGRAMRADLVQAIASESEELALSGLAKARAEVESGGEFAARNFQSWSGGVKNFVQVAKLVRDPAGSATGEGSTNFNLFFMAAPGTVSATEPKQVTEANPPVS